MSLKRAKVLIIDDEKDFCTLIKANLERFGDYEVIIVTDAQQGLKKICEIEPDLILLDIIMPGLSGLEILKRLKEDGKTVAIPVLMLTAVKDPGSRQKAASLYDEDYIEKPMELEYLKSRIDKALVRVRGE